MREMNTQWGDTTVPDVSRSKLPKEFRDLYQGITCTIDSMSVLKVSQVYV